MKACLIQNDRSLRWEEVPTPVPGPGEALVRVKAFGLNRADLMQRAGNYPPPPGCPDWMGLEIAGDVAELGSPNEKFRVGTRVCALLGGGGYAEFALVKQDMLMPIPEGFSYPEGAALPEAYSTAFLNLVYEANLQKGETFLVFAGGSGVGIASAQIARALGAHVISTARTEEKVQKLREMGVEKVFNSRSVSLVDVMTENPCDVVLDCVGGPDAGKLFSLMNRYGRWVSIATLAGGETVFDMQSVYKKGLRLIGSTLRSRTPEKKAEICHRLTEEIFPLFVEGKIHPVIWKVFPATEVEAAQAAKAENRNFGMIICQFPED